MRAVHYLLYIFVVAIGLVTLIGCSSGSSDNDSDGWITITSPGEGSVSINAEGSRMPLFLSGDAFLSEGGERTETICPCSGWECLFNPPPPSSCQTYTWYDDHVSVYIYNETTGGSDYADITKGSSYNHWEGSVEVVLGENRIMVTASDHFGKNGTAQVTVYLSDTGTPTILHTAPPDGAVDISVYPDITATFSEEMDIATITPASFTVNTSGVPVDGDISFNWHNTTATFTPQATLAYNTTYVANLNGQVADLVGHALSETSWSFTTVPITKPANLTATFRDEQIILSWDAVPGADYYNIYYHTYSEVTPENGTLIGGIPGTTHTHTGLVNDTFYFYVVTAVGQFGESAPSTKALAMPRLWLTQFGTSGQDAATDIALDAAGNRYITGSTGGALASTGGFGNWDAFIAKFDTDGNRLWVRQFGTTAHDGSQSIAVDADGTSTVTGYTYGDMAGTGNAGESDIFVARFDAAGTLLWISQTGTAGTDHSRSIAVDGVGNSYITGWIPDFELLGWTYPFVASFSSNGNLLWMNPFDTRGFGRGIAVDANGNSVVTGSVWGILPDSVFGTESWNIFVDKYDASGNRLWSWLHGTTSNDGGVDIELDEAGNSRVTGYTFGRLGYPGHFGGRDIFFARFDASGYGGVHRQLGTAENDWAAGIAIDADGNNYITGNTLGDMAGTGNAGMEDIFAANLSPFGTPLWTIQMGTEEDDSGAGIAVDVNGRVYITGETDGHLAGPYNLGWNDIFITRVDGSSP